MESVGRLSQLKHRRSDVELLAAAGGATALQIIVRARLRASSPAVGREPVLRRTRGGEMVGRRRDGKIGHIHAAEFVGVGVDVNEFRLRRRRRQNAIALRRDFAEAGADDEQQVGFLHALDQRRRTGGAEIAGEARRTRCRRRPDGGTRQATGIPLASANSECPCRRRRSSRGRRPGSSAARPCEQLANLRESCTAGAGCVAR